MAAPAQPRPVNVPTTPTVKVLPKPRPGSGR